MSTREHTDVFITQLDINEVWELKDIQIPLSDVERKHLILTGKNGSGKTTLLNAIKAYHRNFSSHEDNTDSWKVNLKKLRKELNALESSDARKRDELNSEIKNYEAAIKTRTGGVETIYSDQPACHSLYNKHLYIFAFFEAKRSSVIRTVNGISKVNIKAQYSIDEKASQHFLQYIVNLKAQRSFAKDDGENDTANGIDNWFENFTRALQKIYEDPGLELVFDRLNFNFLIRLSNGVEFDFNQLSDGYSAIISIVSELILRMEKLSPISYDLQGLVLIDEIETHLHVDLQKKILPFLTTFFPRIQFIVTTHSPFVISSIENAVVYDLERKIRVEDASGYSYDTIIESYFDSDKYSEALKKKVTEYETLIQQQNRSSEQEVKLIELEKYFDNLPMQLSPELEVKVQQLRLARL